MLRTSVLILLILVTNATAHYNGEYHYHDDDPMDKAQHEIEDTNRKMERDTERKRDVIRRKQERCDCNQEPPVPVSRVEKPREK